MTCPLCVPVAETVFWQDEACRVISVDEPTFPGFCRVVWSAHVAEMSDLLPSEQKHLLTVVLATEKALRSLMQPDKINLASLGNVVPHLHWHVIPRFRDDANFPDPIWAAAHREGVRRSAPPAELLVQAIEASMREA